MRGALGIISQGFCINNSVVETAVYYSKDTPCYAKLNGVIVKFIELSIEAGYGATFEVFVGKR